MKTTTFIKVEEAQEILAKHLWKEQVCITDRAVEYLYALAIILSIPLCVWVMVYINNLMK